MGGRGPPDGGTTERIREAEKEGGNAESWRVGEAQNGESGEWGRRGR